MRLVVALVVLVAAALPASAGAETGALTQLPGPGGCISDTFGSDGRVPAGCAGTTGLSDANGLALSPDGRHIYVTSGDDDLIAGFARDPTSGAVQPLTGPGACLLTPDEGRPVNPACAAARALDGATDVVVSPDGRFVYVAAPFSRAIAILARDPGTGLLTQPPGPAGCVSTGADCTRDARIARTSRLALSVDGSKLYSAGDNRVLAYTRDAASGALAPVAGPAGCVVRIARAGCTVGRALNQPLGLVLSRDGRSLYVAATRAVLLLRADPSTGTLAQPAGRAGCWSTRPEQARCTAARGLDDAQSPVLSPDGRSLYVTGTFPSSIAVFKRSADGRLSQLAGRRGCIGGRTCATASGLDGPRGAAVSPDGRNVYVVTNMTDAILSFRRGANGALMQLPGRQGCVIDVKEEGRPPRGCTASARGTIGNPDRVQVTPDGRFVYVTPSGLVAFARAR